MARNQGFRNHFKGKPDFWCITGGFRQKAEEQLLGKPKEDNRWVQGTQGESIIGSHLNMIYHYISYIFVYLRLRSLCVEKDVWNSNCKQCIGGNLQEVYNSIILNSFLSFENVSNFTTSYMTKCAALKLFQEFLLVMCETLKAIICFSGCIQTKINLSVWESSGN